MFIELGDSVVNLDKIEAAQPLQDYPNTLCVVVGGLCVWCQFDSPDKAQAAWKSLKVRLLKPRDAARHAKLPPPPEPPKRKARQLVG